MRALIVLAGFTLLAACSNNDQRDNNMNVDENLTAENIVSNDVTAIDAVTGDAANIAAETEIDVPELNAGTSGNSTAPARPGAKPATKAPEPSAKPAPAPAPQPESNSAG